MLRTSINPIVKQQFTKSPHRVCLVLATALAGSFSAQHPASAQDASQLAAIQSQISALQTQLRRLQRQAVDHDTALKRAQADAAQARADAAQAMSRTATYAAAVNGVPLSTPPGYYPPVPVAAKPLVTMDSSGHPGLHLGGVTVTLGGFLDATALYRSRNLTAGTSTSYNAIPYNNSVNGHVSEFRETAQYSRFSVKLTGAPSSQLDVTGYLEGDFAGAATTANSTQTNSYNPRLRQAWVNVDDKLDGLHLLAGQAYTMATGNLVGITPLKESLLAVIDGNNIPGFTYLRQAQIRLVKDFGKTFWLGLSLEEPQETYAFAGATAATTTPNLKLPNGSSLSYSNLGGSFLNSTAGYSFDTAPDLIAKAALDTQFGHFEVFGLGRFFRTRVTPVSADGTTETVFGGGVGGSMVVPIIPKKLDFIGNVLAGDGIGRYTPGQLPDATFDANGKPVPLAQFSALVGLDAHPTKLVELYTYAGTDTDRGSTFAVSTTSKGKTTTTGYGYGTPYASNTFCDTEGGSCSAQTRSISDISAGLWWTAMHGDFGSVRLGAQYSYVKKIAFSGIGGRPETDENIAYFTVRFTPFDQSAK